MKRKVSLEAAALRARARAYAPYSRVQVGAAVLTSGGVVHTGCNVENSSYGGTVCAERVAVFKAVSEGATRITEIAVATDASPPWPPCGFCRQVIAEFAAPDARITAINPRGERAEYQLSELLPHAFLPEALHRARKNGRK